MLEQLHAPGQAGRTSHAIRLVPGILGPPGASAQQLTLASLPQPSKRARPTCRGSREAAVRRRSRTLPLASPSLTRGWLSPPFVDAFPAESNRGQPCAGSTWLPRLARNEKDVIHRLPRAESTMRSCWTIGSRRESPHVHGAVTVPPVNLADGPCL